MPLKLRGCCTQGSSGLKENASCWIGGASLLGVSHRGQEELRGVGKNSGSSTASSRDEFFQELRGSLRSLCGC